MDSVSVNSKAPAVRNVVSIIDTGTTLIIGDSLNVRRFYTQIPGSKDASGTVGPGYYTVPCNAVPTVQFTFGGKAFSIPPSIFSLGRVSATSSDCVGAIVNGGSQSFWVQPGTTVQFRGSSVLTMGLFCAALRRDSGSCALPEVRVN